MVKKKTMSKLRLQGVHYLMIDPAVAGQRIDNYLISRLKGVPKSRIYRLLRKGEVRVNGKRILAQYHLLAGDRLRIPPVRLAQAAKAVPPSMETIMRLKARILYEDDNLLILNKPSGMAVHGGQTVRLGVIEILRHAFAQCPQLELAHRLDADTSGVLLLAKNKRTLREIHSLLRAGHVKKHYLTLTMGTWRKHELHVTAPLHKKHLSSGKHMVQVSQLGKEADTFFKPISVFGQATYMDVLLRTGRTHQIRVHASFCGHPIAGDERYGNKDFNAAISQKTGLKRMFLHASQVKFVLPSNKQLIKVSAPLDPDLQHCLIALERT